MFYGGGFRSQGQHLPSRQGHQGPQPGAWWALGASRQQGQQALGTGLAAGRDLEAAEKASVVGNRETRPQHTRCLDDSHVAAVEDPDKGGSEAPNEGLVSGGNCPAQVVKGTVPCMCVFA